MMTPQEWASILASMLRGIRAMAQLQADAGSSAWAQCVKMIDQTLEEAKRDGIR